jgi:hypothetical protein
VHRLHLIAKPCRKEKHGTPGTHHSPSRSFDAASVASDRSVAKLHPGQALHHCNCLHVPSKEFPMSARKTTAFALAAAAAVMFATVSVNAAAADEGHVKCEGVNACKGQSACKTAKNSCKGQNACKGAGFLELTKAECDAAHAQAKKAKN